ncbi:MAG TPA: DUF711 family protein [Candidatus Lokiarchaeia archaeon]|nr:DUF711 family protein [Candidatus Lokiarchaeia archaeon]
MQVRSLTLGVPTELASKSDLENYFSELSLLRDSFKSQGITVQSIRGSFEPIRGDGEKIFKTWERQVNQITETMASSGALFSAPFWTTNSAFVGEIARIQNGNSLLFNNIPVSGLDGEIYSKSIHFAAEIISGLSLDDPFANLRFCASAGVPPNTPFFPASYEEPGQQRPQLSISLESADDMVALAQAKSESLLASVQESTDLSDFSKEVKNCCEEMGHKITDCLEESQLDRWADFRGIDLSPAPYPASPRSIANALEIASGLEFGDPNMIGTIAAITEGIHAANVPTCGFNGVMLPVLEDNVIAQRTSEHKVNLGTLLLYSTVCGTGLDTVPLPGDISVAELKKIIYSVAVLSARLHKPLTARLMPIPGKQAGDITEFSFEYFANSAILEFSRKPV